MKILKAIGNTVEQIVKYLNKFIWSLCYYFYLGLSLFIPGFIKKRITLKKKLDKRLANQELIMIVTLYVVTFVTILRFLLPASVTYKEDISFTSINTNESETTESDDNSSPNNTNTDPNTNVTVTDNYRKYLSYDFYNLNFVELQATNPDVVAFIRVEGTNINYPVVKTTDNSYYLDHSIDKSYNTKGWIYADYRNDFNNLSNTNNLIIYGHHILNETMFGTLDNILTSKETNLKIYLKTPANLYTYQIFSSYQIEPEITYLQTDFLNEERYLEFLNTLKSRSNKDYQQLLYSTDKIITLSTCSLDNTERIVVHGKLLSIN